MHCMRHGQSCATTAPWQQLVIMHSHAQQAAKYGSKNMAATPATTVRLRRPAVSSYGAAMLPGGWVRGCACGGAPAWRLLGTGTSNRPQHRRPLIRTTCKQQTGQRVTVKGANVRHHMRHGTCRSMGAISDSKKCSALEHIADFLSNVLQSGGLFIGRILNGGTMGGRYLKRLPRYLPRPIWPGASCTAHKHVRVLCATHSIVRVK